MHRKCGDGIGDVPFVVQGYGMGSGRGSGRKWVEARVARIWEQEVERA